MAQYNFEGDISGITDPQFEFINKALIDNGFKDDNTKVIFEPVGKAGDNYVATVKRITLEGENGIMTLIAKIAPSNEMVRMTMNSFLMFQNESTMYTKVLPKFTELEKEADVPADYTLRYAKCYGCCAEKPNEVILLEDLKTSNFTMLDRFESLTDACVRSVLKNFAILHALSFALKKKEPEAFDQFRSCLLDMWSLTLSNADIQIYFQKLENDVLSVLDDENHKNIMRHKISEGIKIAAKLAKVDSGSKHSIIQQGDSWTNNIMFKIEDDSNVESIMIDYQISRENNPSGDLLYMIFNCTDQETRDKYFYDWIDYYHSELEKCLSNFDLKANFVYSRDQLDADLKRYGKMYFALSVMLASVLTRKSEDTINFEQALEDTNGDMSQMLDSSTITVLDDETVSRFRNRVVGLITGFTKFGLM